MNDATPPVGDIEAVYQEEPETVIGPTVVDVSVSGPVEVHELPSVSGGMRSWSMDAADAPKRISGSDPRRRVVRLISDQAFYVGVDQNSVATSYSARWPANVTCVITHRDEIWVKLVVTGTLSMIAENWAS